MIDFLLGLLLFLFMAGAAVLFIAACMGAFEKHPPYCEGEDMFANVRRQRRLIIEAERAKKALAAAAPPPVPEPPPPMPRVNTASRNPMVN